MIDLGQSTYRWIPDEEIEVSKPPRYPVKVAGKIQSGFACRSNLCDGDSAFRRCHKICFTSLTLRTNKPVFISTYVFSTDSSPENQYFVSLLNVLAYLSAAHVTKKKVLWHWHGVNDTYWGPSIKQCHCGKELVKLTWGLLYITFYSCAIYVGNMLVVRLRRYFHQGSLSTVDLLVLTSSDQLIFILEILFSFLQNKLP
jgi:hypothetical protein